MGTVGGRRTHYELLGVSESADLSELRAAYRAAALEAHPDSGGETGRMRRLNEAWHVLQDPGRRATYDRELADERRRQAGSAAAPRPASPADASGSDAAPFDGGPHTPAGGVAYGVRDAGSLSREDAKGGTPVPAVEGWLALLPPAALVATMALFGAAFLFASPALLVFSGGAALMTVGLFVFVPLRAFLQVSSRPPTDRRPREE